MNVNKQFRVEYKTDILNIPGVSIVVLKRGLSFFSSNDLERPQDSKGSAQRIEARSCTFCSSDLLSCTSTLKFALVRRERHLLLRLSLPFRLFQSFPPLRILALFFGLWL